MAIHRIHIAKAGKDAYVEVDDTTFSEEVFVAIIAEGLKACLNAKMTKVGAITKLEGAELHAAQAKALEIANKNLADLKSGDYKFAGSKAKSAEPREVLNEAMRQARNVVRDALKAAGVVLKDTPAKDITEAAKRLVDNNPSYIAQAKAELAKRKQTPTVAIDLEALGIHVDHEAISARKEALAAKRKENLSAAQAGKTTKRAGVAKTTKSKPKASPADVLASIGVGKPDHHITH